MAGFRSAKKQMVAASANSKETVPDPDISRNLVGTCTESTVLSLIDGGVQHQHGGASMLLDGGAQDHRAVGCCTLLVDVEVLNIPCQTWLR